MRTELEHIERIEKYLLNNMSETEVLAIENEMKSNPEFAHEIELQKQLVKRIYRNAMLSALENAHNQWATPKWNFKKAWLNNLNTLIIIVFTGAVALIIWFYASRNKTETSNTNSEIATLSNASTEVTENQENSHVVNKPTLDTAKSAVIVLNTAEYEPFNFQKNEVRSIKNAKPSEKIEKDIADPKQFHGKYQIGEENVIDPKLGGSFVDRKTGTRISIKPNALIYANKKAINSPVKIIYKEYRSKGDMVLSDIPMHWFGKDSMPFSFHSEGMFSFLVDADSGEVVVNKKVISPITVEFTPNKLTDSLNFFYLGEKDTFWQFITKIEFENGKKNDSIWNNELRKALKNPFTGELKRNWSEPQKVDGGIMRYGFWGHNGGNRSISPNKFGLVEFCNICFWVVCEYGSELFSDQPYCK